MIELAAFVALGLIVMFARLSWQWRMRIISNPGITDVVVFIGVTLLHWGTFSGVMVATIAAFFCSLTLSALRWAFGHVEKNRYIPGIFNIGAKL